MSRYSKFLVAGLSALLIVLTGEVGDVEEETVDAILSVLAALGVYAVPNRPGPA